MELLSSCLCRLQKVVLEMLSDRGMRLPNPQMLEISFDAFREQFNGRFLRCVSLFTT
jgi:hypothetical protein